MHICGDRLSLTAANDGKTGSNPPLPVKIIFSNARHARRFRPLATTVHDARIAAGRIITVACTDYIHPGETMNTTETTTTEESPAKQTAEAAACKSKYSGCCSPNMSSILAGIAIVIAVYALLTGPNHSADMQVQDRLTNIEEQVSSINMQLNQLDADVKSNRENLIHTRLQKALENVQEIGDMATTATRAKLAEIETILNDIISPSAVETPAPAEEIPAIVPDESPAAEPTPIEAAPTEAAPEEPAPDTSALQIPTEPSAEAAQINPVPAKEPAASPDAGVSW